ncbi:60S acidic ribosomal protein p1, partial [Phtheirospermum japonicum]
KNQIHTCKIIPKIACTYAALVLHDDGIAVTAEKIATLVQTTNLTVESYWPSLFAKLCEKKNIEDLVMKVGSGVGAAVAVSAPSGGTSGGAVACLMTWGWVGLDLQSATCLMTWGWVGLDLQSVVGLGGLGLIKIEINK